MKKEFINDAKLFALLANTDNPSDQLVDDILQESLEFKGISLEKVAVLLNVTNESQLEKLFHTAYKIKEEIYGRRLVLFAPLYTSNYCSNNCLYCGFRADNREISRHALSLEQIHEETVQILEQGHKRILMLMGENHKESSIDSFIEAIETVYSARDSKGSSIRRINVEIAPLSEEEFKVFSAVPIGTYTVFQETYHRETYKKMHPTGKKADYDWRVHVMDRALANGMHDVGIGALFGLFDYRFEVLSLIEHANYMDKYFGVGPHTISIPRIKPAKNAPVASNIPYPVSDLEFKKIVSILRLAVPYTGMILSTREPAKLRTELYDLGVSQISAGSKTTPGGYKQAFALEEGEDDGQFSLNDCRTSGEVIADVINHGFIPSFCTACYRKGRVGEDFMDQAKPGLIKLYCQPNGLTTLKEYLVDYATPETREIGEKLIQKELSVIPDENIRKQTEDFLKQIEKGDRDLYF